MAYLYLPDGCCRDMHAAAELMLMCKCWMVMLLILMLLLSSRGASLNSGSPLKLLIANPVGVVLDHVGLQDNDLFCPYLPNGRLD